MDRTSGSISSVEFVAECPRSVHDLSRIQLNDEGMPRFNMPFELGLMMGAKHFGGKKHNGKSALIMVSEPYRMPAYLSDLSGSDPSPHHGNPTTAIDKVRRYLHSRPLGAPLPGTQHINDALESFQLALPEYDSRVEHKARRNQFVRRLSNVCSFCCGILDKQSRSLGLMRWFGR